MRWFKLAALLLALAGCGSLPRPFEGAPGATAVRLAAPPPSRLAVPPPKTGVAGADATPFSVAMAKGLRDMEVPAFATAARPGDWVLDIAATETGSSIIPAYTVRDPKGAARGTTQGAPVSAAEWTRPGGMEKTAAAQLRGVGDLLTKIEAERRENDPSSLVNRPSRIFVPDVTGAPGDGNTSLARQMRRELPQYGFTLLEKPESPDFVVRGTVKITPAAGKQDTVEITWVVQDSAGAEAGKIAQLNDIPRGSLNGLWVDVAVVVAQEAANGVHGVILNRVGAGRLPVAKKTP